MPTYEVLASFWRDWEGLGAGEKDAFLDAVEKLVRDLEAGKLRKGLRVKRVQGTAAVFELTWADDGRATFEYGDPVRPGEALIVWRRIGRHDIVRRP